jgi:uncharacterized protein Veg
MTDLDLRALRDTSSTENISEIIKVEIISGKKEVLITLLSRKRTWVSSTTLSLHYTTLFAINYDNKAPSISYIYIKIQ